MITNAKYLHTDQDWFNGPTDHQSTTNDQTVLQIILTTISTGKGQNETNVDLLDFRL